MSTIRNINQFALAERQLSGCLDAHLIPLMDKVQSDLSHRQGEEMIAHNKSVGGILSALAGAGMPGVDTSQQLLKATGEWNSKSVEDYIAMCSDELNGDKGVMANLQNITSQWREAFVAEIGQARYDAASKSLNCDLAVAYVDYRIEQRMIDRMVEKETPKSTMEYVIRKGASESLFGLGNVFGLSGLHSEINAKAETRFAPSNGAKVGAHAVAFVSDAIGTGGLGSWSALAKLAGAEVVFAGVDAIASGKSKSAKQLTIEDCISKGVFGSDKNVFDDIRSYTPTYMSPQRAAQLEHEKEEAERVKTQAHETLKKEPVVEEVVRDTAKEPQQPQTTNESGWGRLMGEMGYTGLGDIGKNLGYVIAMLPDVITGLFTGKTQSLHLRDNLVPMASVVAGLFIKNPVLKLLLIGMGGINLLNKAGHEQLARHDNPNLQRFKQYPDEELNSRITSPVISGNSLVANIDRTPCTITLPDNVVMAYQSGALPLNTLANAVLAKYDANVRMAQQNYELSSEQNQNRNLSYK